MNCKRNPRSIIVVSLVTAMLLLATVPAVAAAPNSGISELPWWAWSVLLFLVCLILGGISIPAGIGGGVLFVPIISGFFPFHFDFVRGAGLLVALASALSAGPSLLRSNLANLRLALPMALLASICSVAGALVGLAIPTSAAQISLGITILFVVALMLKTGGPASTTESQPTALSEALRLYGVTYDPETDCRVGWKACNTLTGLVLFSGIGFLAGMFGMGAGWANVPTLNIVMGIPLRVSAGTSSFILSLVDSAAAWVYLQKGAVLAAVIVPSMCGMMLGARIGVETLRVLKASAIRKLVISLLLLAGVRALMKGVGL